MRVRQRSRTRQERRGRREKPISNRGCRVNKQISARRAIFLLLSRTRDSRQVEKSRRGLTEALSHLSRAFVELCLAFCQLNCVVRGFLLKWKNIDRLKGFRVKAKGRQRAKWGSSLVEKSVRDLRVEETSCEFADEWGSKRTLRLELDEWERAWQGVRRRFALRSCSHSTHSLVLRSFFFLLLGVCVFSFLLGTWKSGSLSLNDLAEKSLFCI